jgi:hypothetical protein
MIKACQTLSVFVLGIGNESLAQLINLRGSCFPTTKVRDRFVLKKKNSSLLQISQITYEATPSVINKCHSHFSRSQIFLTLTTDHLNLWCMITIITLFIEYILVINLFRDTNIANVLYKFSQT